MPEEYSVKIQRKDRQHGSVSYDVFRGPFLVHSAGKFFIRDKAILDNDEVLQRMAEYHAYSVAREVGLQRNNLEKERLQKRREALIGIPYYSCPDCWEDHYLGDTGSRNVRMAQIEKLKAQHGLS